MEETTSRCRVRLNLFDALVLIAALAVGGFLAWKALKPAPQEVETHTASMVRYTVRFQKMIQGTGERVQAGDELSEYGLDDAKTSLTVTADGETLTFTRGDQAASGDWYLYCTEDGTVRMVSDDTVKVFQLLDGSIYDLALLPTLHAVTMDTLHAVSITGADGVRIDLRVTDGVRKAGSRDVTAETEALMDELSGLAVTACVDYAPAEGAAAICGLDAPAAALTLTYANAVGAEETLTVTVGLPIGDGGRYVALSGDSNIYRMEETSLVQLLTLAETGLK